MINLVWLKRDLRLQDHQPLWQACQQGYPVVLLYIIEPEYWQLADTSTRHWQFIKQSLESVNKQLPRGKKLWIANGKAEDVIFSLHQKFKINQLFSHEETGNLWTFHRDLRVKACCANNAIQWVEYKQFGVKRGWINRDNWDAFWQSTVEVGEYPVPNLQALMPPAIDYQFDLSHSFLEQSSCANNPQSGGAEVGTSILNSFIESRHQKYLKSVSSPVHGPNYSSRLSPYLAYGCVSLKQVVHRTVQQLPRTGAKRALAAFKSRLHWHCHFIQKLEMDTGYEQHSVHADLRSLRQDSFDQQAFLSWCHGMTGVPFIDACMRMLKATGWLPFRMRAMLMAYSSYHLWQPWQKPAQWLAKMFVDYEPGIHYPQVQMQSGTTGINPFRIYNPVLQGQKFDASGHFIRLWVPELDHLDTAYIHQPWLSPALKTDVYPIPETLPDDAAKMARNTLFEYYKQHVNREETQRIVKVHASRRHRRKPKAKSATSGQLTLF